MFRRQKTAVELEKECADFNARTGIGDKVCVRLDDGTGVLTITATEAQVLSGHSAVIWVDGIRGCYALDRVTPIISKD